MGIVGAEREAYGELAGFARSKMISAGNKMWLESVWDREQKRAHELMRSIDAEYDELFMPAPKKPAPKKARAKKPAAKKAPTKRARAKKAQVKMPTAKTVPARRRMA